MKRIILGGLAGAVIYFIWGALSWMVFPWHDVTLLRLDNEDAVMESLRQQIPASGAYFFPYMPAQDADQATQDAYAAKHRQGPLGFLLFHAGGKNLAMGPAMARGFVIDLLSALVLAWLLSRKSGGSYGCRVIFVLAIALFASLTTHGMYWNWMLFPCGYTLAMFADVIGGWTLAALAMAAIVKPREPSF